MDLQSRLGAMSRPLQVLVILTAVLSLGAIVTSIGPAADGETDGYTRIALGILGAAGAGLIVFGKDYGRTGLMVALAWAAIQTIFYATEPDGNWTRQLVDALMGASSETSVNDTVTEYSAIGINLVGLGMLALGYACRAKVVDWKNRVSNAVSTP